MSTSTWTLFMSLFNESNSYDCISMHIVHSTSALFQHLSLFNDILKEMPVAICTITVITRQALTNIGHRATIVSRKNTLF